MYVTRPLSFYKQNPSALALPPPEGPNSGVLVILDEAAEATCCFGLCKTHLLHAMPLPQNKKTELVYPNSRDSIWEQVALIPVLDQPLSSNMYYLLSCGGKHKGKAVTSSKEEDVTTNCCCRHIHDVKPQTFNNQYVYQQFQIHPSKRGVFHVKSVAEDGFPPSFLRLKNGFQITTSSRNVVQLCETPGLDATLRGRLPELNFPISYKTSKPVVVGKWYTPFMFIKDSCSIKDQIKTSLYYEVTLEQKWEQIFECEIQGNKGNYVVVDVDVKKEVVSIAGSEVRERNMADQVMWFRSGSDVGRREITVGLSSAIVDRMKWEEQRFGWIDSNEVNQRVNRREEYRGIVGRRKLCSYVLVESFIVKRMDGSLVLTYDFRHANKIRSKWT